MNQDHADVRVEIVRIKEELARLRDELHALKQERQEPVGPRIKQRMTELEAELQLYELEQELASTQMKKRRWFFKQR
jgi:chromosome segregation ATPase